MLKYLNLGRLFILREFARHVEALIKQNAKLKERVAKAETQLAGCGTAALGYIDPPAKPGDYGYSASYNDVLTLRLAYESQITENMRLVDKLIAKNNRIDDDTKTIDRLRSELAAQAAALEEGLMHAEVEELRAELRSARAEIRSLKRRAGGWNPKNAIWAQVRAVRKSAHAIEPGAAVTLSFKVYGGRGHVEHMSWEIEGCKKYEGKSVRRSLERLRADQALGEAMPGAIEAVYAALPKLDRNLLAASLEVVSTELRHGYDILRGKK